MLSEHHIEDLLRRSNPEPDAEALRMEPHVVEASTVSIVQRRGAMGTSINRLKPLTTPPGSTRRARGFAIATGAAVTIFVLIGSVALLTRTGIEESAPVAQPAEVTLLEGTWERSVINELDPLVHFVDLELEGTTLGLVAAAVMEGVWISEDRAEWHQALAVPYEPSALSPDTTKPSMTVPPPAGLVESYVRHVAEYDGALYAVGNMATGINTPELESRLVVWRSEDGRQWDEITLESAAGAFTTWPSAVMVVEDALLVYGEDGSAYRSADGLVWTRFGPEETGIETALSGVARYGDRFVAIGAAPAAETEVSFVLTSSDGVNWTQLPGSEFPAGHHPYGPLVEFDGALYVGGLTFLDDAAGAVWRSTDGRTFSKVDLGVRAPFGSSGDEESPAMYGVEDLIVTPYGMLVIGHVPGSAGNHSDAVLLATEDGISYELVADTDDIFVDASVTAGTVLDDHVVLVGHEVYSDTDQGNAYQWVWKP